MEKCKEYITEGIIHKKDNFNVVDSNHGPIQRKKRRQSGDITISDKDYKKIFDRVIDHLVSRKLPRGDYLVYSKTYEHGLVFAYKPGQTGKSRIVVITYLPKFKSFAKAGTERLLVESYFDNNPSKNMLQYIDSLLGDDYLTEEDRFYEYMKVRANALPANQWSPCL